MKKHKTIEVHHESGRVEIDAEIYPLIEYFWERGWDTACSCQGDCAEGEQAYITFTLLAYAERALNALHEALLTLKDEDFTVALNTWYWYDGGGIVGQILISPPGRLSELVEALRKLHG